MAADQKELVSVFRVVLQEMDLSIDQEYGHCFLGRATVRHVLDKQLHLHTHTHTHTQLSEQERRRAFLRALRNYCHAYLELRRTLRYVITKKLSPVEMSLHKHAVFVYTHLLYYTCMRSEWCVCACGTCV